MNRLYILAVATLLACSRPDDVDRAGRATITAYSLDTAVPETDYQLARRVEVELASNQTISLGARNVHVDVTNHVVTLLGSVDDVSMKEAVGAVADRVAVRGTAGTLNKVEVSPSRNQNDIESDETIAYSLQRSFGTDSVVSLDADHVTIEVIRGEVWLRGHMGTAATATRVERIVEQTPGVVAVWTELSPQR